MLRVFALLIFLLGSPLHVLYLTEGQEATQITFQLLDTIPAARTFEWYASKNKMTIIQNLESGQAICIWDEQNETCNTIKSYSESVWSADISPNGQLLAVGLAETVEILNIETQTNIITLDQISEIAWSQDGYYLAAGDLGGIHIFNTENWVEERTLFLSTGEHRSSIITDLAWSPDNQYIVAQYLLPNVGTIEGLDILEINSRTQVYTGASRGFSWVKEGEFFAVIQPPSGIVLLDGATFETVREYPAWNPYAMSWSPDGKFLIYHLDEDDKLITLDAESGIIVSEQIRSDIKKTAWSYDGQYMAVLENDQILIYKVLLP